MLVGADRSHLQVGRHLPVSTAAPPAPGLTGLARDVAASTRGHDLALYAAGVTFYAAIGVVPLLLLAVYLAGLVVGEQALRDAAGDLTALLPTNLGAEDAADRLLDVGSRLSGAAAIAALVPGSLYGEGLVRAFDRLSVRGEEGRRTLRGRVGSLVLAGVSPLVVLLAVGAADLLTGALGDGTGPRLLGVYLTFLLTWLVVSPLLLLAYRGLGPQRPGRRALLWGAYGTGSVVAGFAMGWVLFLGIEVPLDAAYGGSTALAAAAVSLGWLFLLHVLALVGYVATLRLDARGGHPRGAVTGADTVREA